ncbi:MAG TPA: alpha/beta hydrolase [Herpetosiphonaceae bacterium]
MTASTRPASGFAEVNGTRLYYEIAGSGQPLVMIHAGVADRRLWDEQWQVFAERYTVIRYDMRGFGKSAVAEGTFGHHDDLYALLSWLGLEQAYLMGCSRGGSTAIDVTLEHPELVKALILVCSGPGGAPDDGSPPPRQWEEIRSSFRARDLQRTSELEVEVWVDGPNRTPEQVERRVRDLVYEMNLIALQNEVAAEGKAEEQALEPPAYDRLGEIRVPTLIIVGDQDQPGVITAGDLMEERIAGARKVVMHGTAHVPSLEQPAEFNRIVLDFLGGL